MATPSLAMIPSGYKASKVYSVLPENGVGDFDFTRATTATRINSSGLIEEMAINVPRLNYPLIDGVVNGCPSLLLEPQSTNLITYSEPISSETGADGITYESFNWNLGFTNCIKFGDNSQTRYRYFTGTIANSTEYVISAFVIMDDLSEPVLGTASNNGDLILRVGGTSATTGNLPNVNMGNNIYRVSSVITSDVGGGSTGLLKYPYQSNKGFRIVGFQLEQGSYATSYIPTNGSTVTRNAETCNGAGNEQVFNDSEGVLFAEISALANDGTSRRITLSDGTSTNRIIFQYLAASNTVAVELINSSGAQCSLTYVLTDVKDNNLFAFKYKQNDFALWVNGFEVNTDPNGSTYLASTLNKLNFSGFSSLFPFYGKTKQLQYYNSALTDSEIEELTSWESFLDMANGQNYTIK